MNIWQDKNVFHFYRKHQEIFLIIHRFKLALELLEPSDWRLFETLASTFLASEFDGFRTTATASGDRGRDGELFSPDGNIKVLFQYSVATDWQGKINATVRRLKETFPDALVLVYVTNQMIGANGDLIKRKLRENHGLTLDIRDCSWFIDRVSSTAERESAAENIAMAVVDPYLSKSGVISESPSALSSREAIAAVTFLGLQWQDDAREKGLTKLAFEALVRSVLENTDSDNYLTRTAVHDKVRELLPGHSAHQINVFVDSALLRLTKKSVRHNPREDAFCISHDEKLRVRDFRAKTEVAELSLVRAIGTIVSSMRGAYCFAEVLESEIIKVLRSSTDAILFDRSQSFAMAVQSGSLAALIDAEFDALLISQLAKSNLSKIKSVDWLSLLKSGVREILLSEDPAIQSHMRSLADAYTLLAFLRQTPDVQGAVEKMFSHGNIWIDTSIVLPLIAETLDAEDGRDGRYTRMIDAARDAGLNLFVTQGVIEEVERHMNRSLMCARLERGRWQGGLPYLFEKYIERGGSAASFSRWLENFRGEARPLQDISDYLREQFGIRTRSLDEESKSALPELRNALQSLWYEKYQRRREKYGSPIDDAAITRLIDHDIECYCGIINLRGREVGDSPFGYSSWWLTVDKATFDLKDRLRSYLLVEPPDSPVISADFMVNYLAFGPVRRRIDKSKEAHLPLLMVLGSASHLTPEIITEAENLRAQLSDMPDRIVRRHVRDYIDQARRRIGPIANAGMDYDGEVNNVG